MKRIILAFLGIVIGVIGIAILYPFIRPNPQPEWNHDAKEIVIEIDTTGYEIDYNHISSARLWGDGNYIWVIHNSGGGRTVYQKTLSENQVRDIIMMFIDAGFFSPDWRIFQRSSGGFSITNVTINLIERQLYDQYHNLNIDSNYTSELKRLTIDFFTKGSGYLGIEFSPILGHIYAFPAEDSGCKHIPDDVVHWPNDMAGFSLSQVRDGHPIEGELLNFAWSVVNQNEDCSLVIDNGTVYDLLLLIPNITHVEPY
ncbi:hypothetical protein ACFLZW_00790 [Chloroflexota bacterium]